MRGLLRELAVADRDEPLDRHRFFSAGRGISGLRPAFLRTQVRSTLKTRPPVEAADISREAPMASSPTSVNVVV